MTVTVKSRQLKIFKCLKRDTCSEKENQPDHHIQTKSETADYKQKKSSKTSQTVKFRWLRKGKKTTQRETNLITPESCFYLLISVPEWITHDFHQRDNSQTSNSARLQAARPGKGNRRRVLSSSSAFCTRFILFRRLKPVQTVMWRQVTAWERPVHRARAQHGDINTHAHDLESIIILDCWRKTADRNNLHADSRYRLHTNAVLSPWKRPFRGLLMTDYWLLITYSNKHNNLLSSWLSETETASQIRIIMRIK